MKEAQALTDKFFAGFPTVKNWMDKTKNDAKKTGYVETLWGRQRKIPDITLPPYTYESTGTMPVNFNPLDFSGGEASKEVPQNIKDYFNERLSKARGFNEVNQIKIEAANKGIRIKDNTAFIAEAERQCINSRVQGGAADLSKLAMISIYENQELRDMGYEMLIPVHDEIIGEVPVENAKRCGEIISQLMIDAAKDRCSVPMKVDPAFFYKWYGEEVNL